MSQTVTYNGVIYVAGQVADDRTANLAEQTASVLAKLERVVLEAGGSKSSIIMINVYLAAVTDFDSMNEVYDVWVDKAHPPARACTEARLADANLRIEMSAIAALAS